MRRWQRLIRWVYGRLFPPSLKNALAFSLAEVESFRPPQLLTLPPGDRVLVLAPHPDDETIGCGGTLNKYAAAGAAIQVAFLTDGAQGDRELRALPAPHPERAARAQALRERRRGEAAAALALLGVQQSIFFDAPDGQLNERVDEVSGKLVRLMEEFQPQIVFLPFMTDRHPDHVAASRCLLAGLERISDRSRLMLCGYEIWTPLYPNIIVDVSNHIDVKRRALEQYASQMNGVDFIASTLGLNRYRAMSGLFSNGYGEAFYLADCEQYRQLYGRLRLRPE